ncbi:unnamed protein product [Amoebophrya sp. A120]|nr:unnamed protein product [Amoebophrya sp. A120]|eukprot:GSA120T00023737001.1
MTAPFLFPRSQPRSAVAIFASIVVFTVTITPRPAGASAVSVDPERDRSSADTGIGARLPFFLSQNKRPVGSAERIGRTASTKGQAEQSVRAVVKPSTVDVAASPSKPTAAGACTNTALVPTTWSTFLLHTLQLDWLFDLDLKYKEAQEAATQSVSGPSLKTLSSSGAPPAEGDPTSAALKISSAILEKLEPEANDIPDAHRNASELILTKGYPLEFHKVTTSDGYILTLFRIPHGRVEQQQKEEEYKRKINSEELLRQRSASSPVAAAQHQLLHDRNTTSTSSTPSQKNGVPTTTSRTTRTTGATTSTDTTIFSASRTATPKPPILLQHGLLDSCATWLVNEPDESLAFILADQGFDVWLGNTRGSTWSLEHVNLTTQDSKFWDFSFDDIALSDTPAVVDYIIANTRRGGRSNEHDLMTSGSASEEEEDHDPKELEDDHKLGYVGHSQGTLQMFVALSQLGPAFAKKIQHYSALAPVASAANQASLLVGSLIALHIDQLFELFGDRAFLPNQPLLHWIAGPVCESYPAVCEDLLFLIVGMDSDPTANMNKTRVPVMVYNSPGGTSVKNMVHWADLVRSGELRKFDYGPISNLYHYGSLSPPSYDVEGSLKKLLDENPEVKRDLTISLYSGGKDALADPKDVDKLKKMLKSVDANVTRTDFQPSYQHLDFTWGMSCKETIYPMVVEDMRRAFGLTSIIKKDYQHADEYERHARAGRIKIETPPTQQDEDDDCATSDRKHTPASDMKRDRETMKLQNMNSTPHHADVDDAPSPEAVLDAPAVEELVE